jgi:CRISPR/Cas system-associated exonuclease Cas4 (RecB family)
MSETKVRSKECISTSMESVSPSGYGNLKLWKDGKLCALKLLRRGRDPLPSHPGWKLGDVFHHMMERLPHGATAEDAMRVWDEEVEKIEAELAKNWVCRGLVPLRQTVKPYTIKKIRAIRAVALPLRDEARQNRDAFVGGEDRVTTLTEENLVSKDGLIKGQADLVTRRDGEWILIDYKSCDVHEDHDEVPGEKRIKDGYELQLRLYAHLLKEARGITVAKALLKTMDGCEHEVTVDEENVQSVGGEARALLREFNQFAQKHTEEWALAKPMPNNFEEGVFGCGGCLFRPKCKAYNHQKRTRECHAGEYWPNDIVGRITEINKLGEGYSLILGENGSGKRVAMRFSGRHPALENLKEGDVVGIFNAVRLQVVHGEGPITCVYQYMENPTEEWQLPLDILGEM